jgi:hypothetical protein
MRCAFSHFPIGTEVDKSGKLLEIRNYYNRKERYYIHALGQTKIIKDPKDRGNIE